MYGPNGNLLMKEDVESVTEFLYEGEMNDYTGTIEQNIKDQKGGPEHPEFGIEGNKKTHKNRIKHFERLSDSLDVELKLQEMETIHLDNYLKERTIQTSQEDRDFNREVTLREMEHQRKLDLENLEDEKRTRNLTDESIRLDILRKQMELDAYGETLSIKEKQNIFMEEYDTLTSIESKKEVMDLESKLNQTVVPEDKQLNTKGILTPEFKIYLKEYYRILRNDPVALFSGSDKAYESAEEAAYKSGVLYENNILGIKDLTDWWYSDESNNQSIDAAIDQIELNMENAPTSKKIIDELETMGSDQDIFPERPKY